tara:strand:- start:1184 stop:1462 length:279 start_codon:yes stop_codon:yes gene_type:complete
MLEFFNRWTFLKPLGTSSACENFFNGRWENFWSEVGKPDGGKIFENGWGTSIDCPAFRCRNSQGIFEIFKGHLKFPTFKEISNGYLKLSTAI